MKKKNGFAFIETIVTIVILSASLLYLYSSYSTIISDEESRLYYNDVAYIYKTNYIREFLEENSNLDNIKTYGFSNSYIVTIGTGYSITSDAAGVIAMFTDEQYEAGMDTTLEKIIQNFNIRQMVLLKSSMFSDCLNEVKKSCDNLSGSDATDCASYNATIDTCNSSMANLSYNMQSFINTLSDTDYEYYLVIEYTEKIDTDTGKVVRCNLNSDESCTNYYAYLGI